MRLLLAILTGKLVLFFTRFLEIGGGSAAPGYYALKIDPNLVTKLASTIPEHIVITGTNGKTTTARMLSHLLQSQGYKVIRNATGSNLERGIASTLIQSSHQEFDIGVWELDEFAFNEIIHKFKPKIVVFLNVFRDQLDRYGEVDAVVKRWCDSLKKLYEDTYVLINGDDQKLLQLKHCFKGKVKTFSVSGYKIKGEATIHDYDDYNYARKDDPFEAKDVRLKGLSGLSFTITINHKQHTINLPLPGIYHIYDALATLLCINHLQLPLDEVIPHLQEYTPAFGRVEKIELPSSVWRHKITCYIFLIKNPAGATQVFQTITPNLKSSDKLLIALNDNLADGTDVSWIWDADFEKLKIKNASFAPASTKVARREKLEIICSGTRAEDLAVRLKYAGFDSGQIEVESELKKALERAKRDLEGHLFILPTYTALLDLQKILAESGVKKHYWRNT